MTVLTTATIIGTIGSPKSQPITLPAGNSLTIKIPILNMDGSTPDLSNTTAEWWLAPGVYAGPQIIPLPGAVPYFKKGTDVGEATLSEVSDQWVLQVQLDPIDTALLSNGILYYEAELVDDIGSVATIAFGRFVLIPTIIRNITTPSGMVAVAGLLSPHATDAGAIAIVQADSNAGTSSPHATDTGAVAERRNLAGSDSPRATDTGAVTDTKTVAGTSSPHATDTGAVSTGGRLTGQSSPKATDTGATVERSSEAGASHPAAADTATVVDIKSVAGVSNPKATDSGALVEVTSDFYATQFFPMVA